MPADAMAFSAQDNLQPTQSAYIERFNGSFRRELLDAHLFRSLAHVRQLVDEWRHDCNTQRPH